MIENISYQFFGVPFSWTKELFLISLRKYWKDGAQKLVRGLFLY